jgi:hypothetical protein
MRAAADKFNEAHMKLYGYEHHATLHDALQIAGWRVYDTQSRIAMLLNAVVPPTPETPPATNSVF